MNNVKIVAQLRRIVDQLEPFLELPRMAGGTSEEADRPASSPTSEQLEFVGSWHRLLTEFADTIEKSGRHLSEKQQAKIRGTLFGGMGSLSDFWLDPRVFGIRARSANDRIQKLRSELYILFTS